MSQRRIPTVEAAKNGVRAVVNKIWQHRHRQGAGYPAVELTEALDLLVVAVRNEDGTMAETPDPFKR